MGCLIFNGPVSLDVYRLASFFSVMGRTVRRKEWMSLWRSLCLYAEGGDDGLSASMLRIVTGSLSAPLLTTGTGGLSVSMLREGMTVSLSLCLGRDDGLSVAVLREG